MELGSESVDVSDEENVYSEDEVDMVSEDEYALSFSNEDVGTSVLT